MTVSLTSKMGAYVQDFTLDDVPEDALKIVRSAFADTVAVIMAGIEEDATRITFAQAAETDSGRGASVCLTDAVASSPMAALVGGTAAHALDYDDQSLSGHPSAVLVPAILAEGWRLNATGQEIAAAYLVGYEVWAELIGRNTGYHAKGWHPTSVFGTVGAAAAVAYLNKLRAEQVVCALAIAASKASGLASNFGTMTKPLHAGLAARNGLVSAQLAAGGMTASADAFNSAVGFLSAVSANTPDRETASRLGDKLYILNHRLCIKRYPTCYFMHRSFEAMVAILAEAGAVADEVERVEVRMGRGQTVVLTHERPQTALEAKFSGQFAIAAAAILGRMGLKEVSDEVVLRPDIQAFLPKVELIPVDGFDPRDPVHSASDSVRAFLKSGKILDSGPISSIKGHAEDPLTRDELWAKFQECTADVHIAAGPEPVFDQLMEIDTLPRLRALPTFTAPTYMKSPRDGAGSSAASGASERARAVGAED